MHVRSQHEVPDKLLRVMSRAIFPRFGEISITLRLLQHTVVSAVFQNRCFGKGQSKGTVNSNYIITW
jgi:hypothetical protein